MLNGSCKIYNDLFATTVSDSKNITRAIGFGAKMSKTKNKNAEAISVNKNNIAIKKRDIK